MPMIFSVKRIMSFVVYLTIIKGTKVLLIAGNTTGWKKYFEKNIRYRIEWIEKEEIQQEGVIFSIIAIKAVTEKIEEAVRELISKYEVEIRGKLKKLN